MCSWNAPTRTSIRSTVYTEGISDLDQEWHFGFGLPACGDYDPGGDPRNCRLRLFVTSTCSVTGAIDAGIDGNLGLHPTLPVTCDH